MKLSLFLKIGLTKEVFSRYTTVNYFHKQKHGREGVIPETADRELPAGERRTKSLG